MDSAGQAGSELQVVGDARRFRIRGTVEAEGIPDGVVVIEQLRQLGQKPAYARAEICLRCFNSGLCLAESLGSDVHLTSRALQRGE